MSNGVVERGVVDDLMKTYIEMIASKMEIEGFPSDAIEYSDVYSKRFYYTMNEYTSTLVCI